MIDNEGPSPATADSNSNSAESQEESPGARPSVAAENSSLETSDDGESLGATLFDPGKSYLKKWLTEHWDAPEKSKKDAKQETKKESKKAEKWKAIGLDVYERKALLLAAAKDLQLNKVKNPLKLAATDIFVEKAQGFLTDRGKWLYVIGATTSGLAVVLMLLVAWRIFSLQPLQLLDTKHSSDPVSPAYLTVLILKSTTAGALILGVVYFLVSLSRALLHEATVLYSRRHSLRFGRLFVYLMSGSMTREDLELVFNWNAEFSTAFKDIQAETIAKSPLTKLLETPLETLKYVTESLKPLMESMAKELREKKDGQKSNAAPAKP